MYLQIRVVLVVLEVLERHCFHPLQTVLVVLQVLLGPANLDILVVPVGNKYENYE